MALLGLRKKKRTSAVLIDVGSASVAGAYAHVVEGKLPILYYSARVALERREDETSDAAMLRALSTLCERLIREGAPALRRETGSGHADSLLVSVAAPWQDTKVRTGSKQQEKAFVFTRAMMQDLVAAQKAEAPGRMSTGESVIGTLLNGYEIANPFGKRATRAELVILSSSIAKEVAEGIEKLVRGAFHNHAVTLVSFAPVAYTVFRDLYPHEKDFLILDVSGEGSDLAFVKNGLLMDVGSTSLGLRSLTEAGKVAAQTARQEYSPFDLHAQKAQSGWLSELAIVLHTFASRHPLPRTLFLLADDDARGFLVRALDAPQLHSLWLSDEPLRIVPVAPGQFVSGVETKGLAVPDIFLAVLALYFAKPIEPLAEPERFSPVTRPA